MVGESLLAASRQLAAMAYDHPLYPELFARLSEWYLENAEQREWRP